MNRDAVPARQATLADGIDYLDSIPGLLKSLKIPSPIIPPTLCVGPLAK
jgi:hypothetical protein